MSKKYQGIFLFEEWLDALNHLPAKTAMTIINNIYRFNVEGIEPPPMKGNAELIQNIMLTHERRSKSASLRGRIGADSRWRGSGNAEAPLYAERNQPEPLRPPLPGQGSTFRCLDTPEEDLTEEDRAWDAQRVEILTRVRNKRIAAENAAREASQNRP